MEGQRGAEASRGGDGGVGGAHSPEQTKMIADEHELDEIYERSRSVCEE
jgi:hypothetical protein